MGRVCVCSLLALLVTLGAASPGRADTFEQLQKKSVRVYNLRSVLLPFVVSCRREKTKFRRLFCEALNERLKAQHQSKIYQLTVRPSAEGPLLAEFQAKPKPTLELTVRGCLTCGAPMLARRGGDISKARFFVFKEPRTIRIRRGRRAKGLSIYDLGDIDVTQVKVELGDKASKKRVAKRILPHLRLDLLFRPVAGVTRIGRRFKYGVTTFELAGHRIYDKCSGKVYHAKPAMKARRLKVNKQDMSCPQNQPRKISRAKVPSKLPRGKVRKALAAVSADLHACYDQFGVKGDAPATIVVAPTGKITMVKVIGQLAGTPTARCVERLVRNVKFPTFKGQQVSLQWPFVVKK